LLTTELKQTFKTIILWCQNILFVEVAVTVCKASKCDNLTTWPQGDLDVCYTTTSHDVTVTVAQSAGKAVSAN